MIYNDMEASNVGVKTCPNKDLNKCLSLNVLEWTRVAKYNVLDQVQLEGNWSLSDKKVVLESEFDSRSIDTSKSSGGYRIWKHQG
jgi:hypothetical protein